MESIRLAEFAFNIIGGEMNLQKVKLKPEDLILDLLSTSEGITIQEIARAVNIHRITASKYLAVMEARGIIKCRNIGRAKLYSVNNQNQMKNIGSFVKGG